MPRRTFPAYNTSFRISSTMIRTCLLAVMFAIATIMLTTAASMATSGDAMTMAQQPRAMPHSVGHFDGMPAAGGRAHVDSMNSPPVHASASLEQEALVQNRKRGGGKYNVADMAKKSLSDAKQSVHGSRPSTEEAAPSADGRVPDQRMVVKAATVSVEVQNIDDVLKLLHAKVEGTGGYLANLSVQQQHRRHHRRSHPGNVVDDAAAAAGPVAASVTVRVPVGEFLSVLGMLREQGKVLAESVSGQDVTGEFVDLQARIRVQRSAVDQLQQILERASTVDETLRIQERMMGVTEVLERLESQAAHLSNTAALSTIQLELSRPDDSEPTRTPSWDPRVTFGRSIAVLLKILTKVADVVIQGTVFAVPLLLVVFAGAVALRGLVKSVWTPTTSAAAAVAAAATSAIQRHHHHHHGPRPQTPVAVPTSSSGGNPSSV